MIRIVSDFETSTENWNRNKAWVWAWATSEVGNPYNIKIGTHIEDFMQNIFELTKKEQVACYFHNLKFDRFFYCRLS